MEEEARLNKRRLTKKYRGRLSCPSFSKIPSALTPMRKGEKKH